MRVLLTFFILLFVLVARAAEDSEALYDRYHNRIQSTLSAIRRNQSQPNCRWCHFVAGKSESYSPACRKTYKDFFKIKDRIQSEKPADSEIDIRIAFGYMDYLKDVEDYYASWAFATWLTSPCKGGGGACRFVQDPDDPSVFRRQIQITGPDGQPRTRNVTIRMVRSSATPNEDENRGAQAPKQAAMTKKAENFFADGLKTADMVLYWGHARDGGGPDFAPPVVNAKSRRTDYDYYHSHRDGAKRMTNALVEAKTPPKIVGIFACYAKYHFREELKAASPQTGFILSGNNEFQTSLSQAYAALDSVLDMRCEDDLNQAVNIFQNTTVGGLDIEPVLVDGVFKTR